MYRKTFVCLCRQTISRIYTIFNTVHAMSGINNIYQFQDIWRIFTRVRVRTTFFGCLKLIPPGRRVIIFIILLFYCKNSWGKKSRIREKSWPATVDITVSYDACEIFILDGNGWSLCYACVVVYLSSMKLSLRVNLESLSKESQQDQIASFYTVWIPVC